MEIVLKKQKIASSLYQIGLKLYLHLKTLNKNSGSEHDIIKIIR